MNWKEWLILVFFVLMGLFVIGMFVAVYWAESKTDRWERTLSSRPFLLGGQPSEDGCMLMGFVSVACGAVIYAALNWHWSIALIAGLALGLFVSFLLSLVWFLFERLLIYVIEKSGSGKG